MKKVALVLSVLIFAFVSCSKNDVPQSDQSATILPKRMVVVDANYPENMIFTYIGNKIATVTNSDGSKATYTYTGNLITKIENFDSNNALLSTVDFSYTNGKVSLRLIKGFGFTSIHKTDYIYNTDGTVTEKNSTLNTTTNSTTQEGSTKNTYANGNLLKKEETVGTITFITTYEYDTKNNPVKNIEGMMLIGMGMVNNVITSSSLTGTNTTPTVYTTTYTYDANGFPTESKASNRTTQYFY